MGESLPRENKIKITNSDKKIRLNLCSSLSLLRAKIIRYKITNIVKKNNHFPIYGVFSQKISFEGVKKLYVPSLGLPEEKGEKKLTKLFQEKL